MALEVGSIVARLSARVDDDAFDRYERRLRRTRVVAGDDVEARLAGDVDERGFRRFDTLLGGARRDARQGAEADLRADVDTRGFRRYEQEVDKAEKSAGRLSRAVGGAGRMAGPAAAGLGIAAGAAGVLGKRFVDSASDIAESTSKIKTVLGASGDDLLKFADTSARAFGISKREALEATGTLGALFRNFGQTREDAAKSSVQFTKLAADLASFNNTSPAEAIEALGAGLRGEAEPLRRYGVLLDDATLRQAALDKGLVKSTKEALTPQTKALAAQAVILAQTKTAQGDFQRTSGGLANSQKILKARLEDASSALGEKLLPFALKVVKALNGLVSATEDGRGPLVALANAGKAVGRAFADVVSKTRDVLQFLSGTDDRAVALQSTVAGLAAIFVTLRLRLLALATGSAIAGIPALFGRIALAIRGIGLAMRANPLGAVITVLAGMGTALVLAYKRSETFRDTVNGVFRVVRRTVVTFLDTFLGFVSTFLGGISTVVSTAAKIPGVGKAFKGLAQGIDDARDKIDGMRRSMRESVKASDAHADALDRQRDRVNKLRERLSGLRKGSDAYKDAAADLKREQGQLNSALRSGKPAGDRADKGYRSAARGADAAALAAQNAGKLTAESYNAIAEQFGVRPIVFKASRFNSASTPGETRDSGVANNLAVGGIPNPGSGARDDHILIAPDGRPVAMMSGTEGVLNRPQMGIVDAALQAVGLGGLDALWGKGMRHYAGGGRLPAYAGGGIVPVPGFPGERANTSILGRIAATVRAFPGLILTDAYGQGHKSPGHTKYGTAADFAGPDRVMDAAVRALVRSGYLVGYDGRFGSKDWPGHGPAAGQGGGNAHLHVEFGAKGAGISGGLDAPKLAGVTIGGPNPMRGRIQKGADRLGRAGQSKLDEVVASMAVPVAGGGSGATLSRAEVLRIAGQALDLTGAFPNTPRNRALLADRARQESGYRAAIVQGVRDVNSGGNEAVGLMQVIPGTFAAHRLPSLPNDRTNPLASMAAAIRYMKARYGRVIGATGRGYARGGLLRRFAGGGLLGGFAPEDLAGLPRHAGGTPNLGGPSKRKRAKPLTPLQGLSRMATPLRALQTDRVESYERLRGQVDTLNTDYSVRERTYNLDDEELIREDGSVDTAAVKERAAELAGLAAIRTRIVKALEAARARAQAIRKTYQTIIGRYVRARKAAKRKDRPSYDARIKTYRERLGEWTGTYNELQRDVIPNARLDLRELLNERGEVLGTKAEQQDPAAGGDLGDLGDTGAGADVDAGPSDTGDTGPSGEPAPAAPDPVEVARQALEQVAAFTAARGELAASFGSNFATGYGGTSDLRAYGSAGTAASADGGEFGVAGQSGGGQAAGRSVTIVQNFAAPPPDPHTWSKGIEFETANL